MKRFGKNSPIGRRNALEPLAARIDAMPLDTVIRLPKKDAPSRTWLWNRAQLNKITLRYCQLPNAILIVRAK
jgi:hypothetical protein